MATVGVKGLTLYKVALLDPHMNHQIVVPQTANTMSLFIVCKSNVTRRQLALESSVA